MDVAELNQFYFRLRIKCAELALGLHHRIFQVEWGWFSVHYEKDGDGEYSMNDYPIPVISVKGYCDIEVNPDCVTVTAKRKRRDVLEGDFEKSFAKLTAYPFEAFGVEGYLDGFYQPGMTLEQFRENVKNSREAEIGFSFRLGFDVTGEQIYEFAKLLRREQFYY